MSAIALEHLAANVGNLKGRDLDFAQSLLQQSKTRLLWRKQIHWVSVLAEKASGHTQSRFIHIGRIDHVQQFATSGTQAIRY